MTSDWSPTSNGAHWDKRARSARVTRIEPSPPTPPSPPAINAGPSACTRGGDQGRLIGIQNDFPGAAACSSTYAVIPSLRVPPLGSAGVCLHGYRGPARAFTFGWSGSGLAIRSYRVRAPGITPQPQ